MISGGFVQQTYVGRESGGDIPLALRWLGVGATQSFECQIHEPFVHELTGYGVGRVVLEFVGLTPPTKDV